MSLITTTQKNHILHITLNAPETLNAMTHEMGTEFYKTLKSVQNSSAIRVVILTGAGRAFSSGGHLDMLKNIGSQDQKTAEALLKQFYANYLIIREIPQPVLCAINGPAVGAGFCVAMACDLRLVAQSAKLGVNFARLGLAPGMAATYLLQKMIGKQKASELLFTAKMLSAQDALHFGLVNQVCPDEELLQHTYELATSIAQNAPLAIASIKHSLQLAETGCLQDIFNFDSQAQAQTLRSEDFREGIQAVLEKRMPHFVGK